jgi:hypothetical protein
MKEQLLEHSVINGQLTKIQGKICPSRFMLGNHPRKNKTGRPVLTSRLGFFENFQNLSKPSIQVL